MAAVPPLITRQRVLLAAIEGTTGTAETLAAADDGKFHAFDTEFTADVPFNRRPGQYSASNLTGTTGTRGGEITFKSEVVGSGTSGVVPDWTNFLLASGFSVSGTTFSPATGSASLTTLTSGHYVDGRVYHADGAAGDFTLTLTDGEPGMFDWRLLGKHPAPVAATLPNVTNRPTTAIPTVKGITFTIGGTAYRISECVLAANNVLTMRQDVTDATGWHSAAVVDRNITITVDPEALAFGTKNWTTDLFAHSTAAINIVIGSGTGETVTINAPAAQLMDVQPGDRDGILTDELEFQCARSTDAGAGDDELTFAFS